LVLLLGILLLTWGCGSSERGAVRGRVTVNGAPLPEGEISFVGLGPNAGPSSGARIENGEYSITAEKGPVAGEYQVQIRAFRTTGRKIWDGMGDEHAPASKKNMVEEMESYLPARYNDKSELRVTIVAGKVNEYNFDLRLDKPRR
jgi:hypothetical protein